MGMEIRGASLNLGDKRPCVCYHWTAATGLVMCLEDYVSAPFRVEKLALYKDGDNADKFFRPAVRSLLVIS